MGTRGYYHSVPAPLVKAARHDVAAWIAMVEGYYWDNPGNVAWLEWLRGRGFPDVGPVTVAELGRAYFQVWDLIKEAAPDQHQVAEIAVFGRLPFFELTADSNLPPGLDAEGLLDWIRQQVPRHGVLDAQDTARVYDLLVRLTDNTLDEALNAIAESSSSYWPRRARADDKDRSIRLARFHTLRDFYADAVTQGHGVYMEFW